VLIEPVARVLFDEAHSEAWTIREPLAAQMQPSHPGDASYALAARALSAAGFAVEPFVDGGLDGSRLDGADALVIAHPSDPAWERTTGCGSPRLTGAELDAIEAFVAAGGGLIVLGETEQAKYGNNLGELVARFGIVLESDTVQDYEHNFGAPSWVLAELMGGERGVDGDVLAGVSRACFYRATTISVQNGARVLARARETASAPGAALVAAARHGAGRVVVLADSDLFGDDCIDQLDHRRLWLNLVDWVARPTDRKIQVNACKFQLQGSAPGGPAAWERLRDAADALAMLQAPDGSLADEAAGDGAVDTVGARTAAAGHIGAMVGAIESLAPEFPHQREYLAAVVGDLRGWGESGFGKPDFSASLDAFRPERDRSDGARSLVVFPMYKQNGSRDTCFEALLIRTPWPDWIAELERTRFDNAKFVPVQLLDSTAGYKSDCAVLFPETVSVGEAAPANHFGAIFCDREAERLRRVAGAAVRLLAVNLPPDCARMLASVELSEQAYILWDLIHDRAHSHGELPFDPFMVRQRAPYWMYSLEELRCDLTAFIEAEGLIQRGIHRARHVQYAILLDRLLRFPITGGRTRNYDGLGGQLLFARLHREGLLRWEDNRLSIDWPQVTAGVARLHADVGELYRSGIDRTKLQHWAAAHDLVAASVAPAAASWWARERRALDDEPDPRSFIDRVLPDEFPLSIFYSSLKAKLAT
jgi:hypothetical protein